MHRSVLTDFLSPVSIGPLPSAQGHSHHLLGSPRLHLAHTPPTPAPPSLGHTELISYSSNSTLSHLHALAENTLLFLPTHPSILTFHLGNPKSPSWLQHPPEACVPAGRLPMDAFQWHLSCGHFALPVCVSAILGCPSLSTGPDSPFTWQSNTRVSAWYFVGPSIERHL